MTITINVKKVIRESTTIVRVLNVQLDIKLKWDSHIKKIQNKMLKGRSMKRCNDKSWGDEISWWENESRNGSRN
jgi:hypothetical protein